MLENRDKYSGWDKKYLAVLQDKYNRKQTKDKEDTSAPSKQAPVHPTVNLGGLCKQAGISSSCNPTQTHQV